MMLGNADIVMLPLIDRLALWCIGNPIASYNHSCGCIYFTFINKLQFKFHIFIVIMKASKKLRGIVISSLYSIMTLYRYVFHHIGYFFFLTSTISADAISNFTPWLCILFGWAGYPSNQSYEVHSAAWWYPCTPRRPDIDPATYISVQHQAWTTRMISQAGVWSTWILAQDPALSC